MAAALTYQLIHPHSPRQYTTFYRSSYSPPPSPISLHLPRLSFSSRQLLRNMADQEPTRSLAQEPEENPGAEGEEQLGPDREAEEEEEEVDSDLEDGDQVIARRYPRNHQNLERHGFRPVWVLGEYPSPDIPEDIKEWLDEDGKRPGSMMVGPLRSLAWLAGLDELVEAIDSAAFTIKDSIETIPIGARPMFPMEYYVMEGMVSNRIAERVMGWPGEYFTPQVTVPVQRAPEGVTENPSPFRLRDISGASRVQGSEARILCMKAKWVKKLPVLERNILDLAGNSLSSGTLWFRALNLDTLRSTLAFFIPQINGRNSDNDFGPGIYTCDKLIHALEYLRGGRGAVMVFKDPRYGSNVWNLDEDEWKSWVARWKEPTLGIANHPVPDEYNHADFIRGRISLRTVPNTGHQPDPELTQLVAVSYRGCEKLGDSLHMIIFVDLE